MLLTLSDNIFMRINEHCCALIWFAGTVSSSQNYIGLVYILFVLRGFPPCMSVWLCLFFVSLSETNVQCTAIVSLKVGTDVHFKTSSTTYTEV